MNPPQASSSLRAVGLSASPNGGHSRSRAVLDRALERLDPLGLEARRVDLAALPAEALLGRARDPRVEQAIATVLGADLLLAATPIYRATYSGLLKVFLDLLPEGGLARAVVVPIAAGGGPGHLLALDHGLRPLFSSLGACVVPLGIYVTPEHFLDGRASPAVLERLDRALEDGLRLARARAAPEAKEPPEAPGVEPARVQSLTR